MTNFPGFFPSFVLSFSVGFLTDLLFAFSLSIVQLSPGFLIGFSLNFYIYFCSSTFPNVCWIAGLLA
jgi:hypothetical protein